MTENDGTPPVSADLVISRAGQASPGVKDIAAAVDDTAARAAIAASTAAVLARSQGTAQGAAAAPPTDSTPAKPREDVASIEFPLLDGRMVVMAPVRGMSLLYRIAMVCGEETGQAGLMLNSICKMLFAVLSIDGTPLKPIGNKVDVLQIMNEIGDDNLDLMMEAFTSHWPSPTKSDLRIVKKNLRGS